MAMKCWEVRVCRVGHVSLKGQLLRVGADNGYCMQGSWGEQGVMWGAGSKRAHNIMLSHTTIHYYYYWE